MTLQCDTQTIDAVLSDHPVPSMESSDASEEGDLSDDEEESPLDFARSQGLTQNYLEHDRRESLMHLSRSLIDDLDVDDPPDALPLPTGFSLNERLTVDTDTLILLQSVIRTSEPTDDIEERLEARVSTKGLGLALPLLRTDHEMDMLHFRAYPKLDMQRLPGFSLLPVNIENDDGFDWPSECLDLPRQVMRNIEEETIAIQKCALLFLQEAVSDSFKPCDEQRVIDSEIRYLKINRVEPVTPPLLPRSPSPTPLEPTLIAAQFEPLSEGSSLISKDIQAVEMQLAKQDTLAHSVEDGSDMMLLDNTDDFVPLIYSPLRPAQDSRSSTLAKRKISDVKIELPLTPIATSTPTKKAKIVYFPTQLHEFIPPVESRTQDEIQQSNDSFEALVDEIIQPFAMEAEQTLANEQLTAADATLRVDVPVVEQICPSRPWLEYELKSSNSRNRDAAGRNSQRRLLDRIADIVPKEFHHLSGVSKIENKLQWSPFPLHLGQVALQETIHEDGYLANIMADMSMENVVTSDVLVWKREGLRVLDELLDDEEELESAYFDDSSRNRDLDTLVHTMGKDLDIVTNPVERSFAGQAELDQFRNTSCLNSYSQQNATDASVDEQISSGTLFSASNAVANFMRRRGANTIAVPSKDMSLAETSRPGPEHRSRELQTSAEFASPKSQYNHPLVPALPASVPQTTVIISSKLLASQRGLIRKLEEIYPNLEYVERDFNSGPASAPSSPEADLIVSPSTGIILTTLQRIRQKPLPGHERSFYGIKDRILDVNVLYSRLLVLVADSIGVALSDNDFAVLSDLIGYAASLDSDVQVLYVPGDDRSLACWIAYCVSTYHFEMSVLQKPYDTIPPTIVPEAKSWDLWLYRTGLNVFAAQVVLSELRGSVAHSNSDPIGGLGSRHLEHGADRDDAALRDFVIMTPNERIRRFETLVGGRKVLERVNQALEQRWLSAADGFSALVGPASRF